MIIYTSLSIITSLNETHHFHLTAAILSPLFHKFSLQFFKGCVKALIRYNERIILTFYI